MLALKDSVELDEKTKMHSGRKDPGMDCRENRYFSCICQPYCEPSEADCQQSVSGHDGCAGIGCVALLMRSRIMLSRTGMYEGSLS